MTLVSTAEIDGEPIPVELQLGYAKLMIFAGIDTTWSAIGSGIWHLAQHADERARLVAVPDDDMLWTTAIEEILRFYAPVTMGRKVIADTEVAGCPVRAGEQMLVTFPAANHDPAHFDHPEDFQIDRAHNRHVAFGLGIHRCIGSNLARLEMTVGLQEWVRAFPNFELDPERDDRVGERSGPWPPLPAGAPPSVVLVNFLRTMGRKKFTRTDAGGRTRPENQESPGECGRLRSAPSGASQADRSTTGRTSGVSLQLDQSHRPSRLAAWRAMPRSEPAAVSRSRPRCHRFTLTRFDPSHRSWCQSEPSSLRPVGVAPDPSAPNHCPVAPRSTCVSRGPGCLADTPPCDPEGSPGHAPAGRRCRRLPVDPVRPDAFAVACSGRRLPVAPTKTCVSPRTRSEMAGEHCPAPIPLCVVNDVGWTPTNRSPLLIAPVRMRCSERCSVNTSQNPRSRGTFKITGLSPKLSRYPQESCRHPRDAHRSCTGKRTAGSMPSAPDVDSGRRCVLNGG